MKLSSLEQFNPITIQCHDNPDADALASGFGLYTYFKEKGKDVRLVYAGNHQIQKKNLTLMVDKLNIPVTFLKNVDEPIKGLLITVDCQYGAGNVTRLSAENIAIIDHHQIENSVKAMAEIRSDLGSCSTLVWQMLKEEGFSFGGRFELGTALYYGLYSDTNQFSEIYNPLDMDMRDSLPCEKSLISLFRNSNLSLHELEIAGLALIKHIYNDDYRYAIIKANPCDPNILGLISDFLLQVDEVDTCIVYNELREGIKFSVRSCVKEVRADELASFLAGDIGSGGGHKEKAGGFIGKRKYEDKYPTLHTEAYFSERMNDYFDHCQIIDAETYDIDISSMKAYVKRKLPQGYVPAKEIVPVGTFITLRTFEGDVDMMVKEDTIFVIGLKGEVYPVKRKKFEKRYRAVDEKYEPEKYNVRTDYVPTVWNRADGSSSEIVHYARVCIPTGETHIHAKMLTEMVKVFTPWDREKYMLGKPGDYLAVRCDDRHDIYVVERDIFYKSYEEIEELEEM
ncbi:MAG: bifunctional oligoribonuclease/PAP phosphatase NrnA [Suilimivivens sp.]